MSRKYLNVINQCINTQVLRFLWIRFLFDYALYYTRHTYKRRDVMNI